MKEQCAGLEERTLMKNILELPPTMQEVVRACFNAAKARNVKQRRYSIEWVYECLLMRIKGIRYYTVVFAFVPI